jgi:hypothetical protein
MQKVTPNAARCRVGQPICALVAIERRWSIGIGTLLLILLREFHLGAFRYHAFDEVEGGMIVAHVDARFLQDERIHADRLECVGQCAHLPPAALQS